MIYRIFIIALLLIQGRVSAQVEAVSIQASGLTCSMCSNAIRNALQSVPFVASVKANIEKSSFDLQFRPGMQPDFDLLQKKVEDAGFFVSVFQVRMLLPQKKISKGDHFIALGYAWHALENIEATGTAQTLKIMDKGFVSAKQLKKVKVPSTDACWLSGQSAPCCTAAGIEPNRRVYHIQP